MAMTFNMREQLMDNDGDIYNGLFSLPEPLFDMHRHG